MLNKKILLNYAKLKLRETQPMNDLQYEWLKREKGIGFNQKYYKIKLVKNLNIIKELIKTKNGCSK